VRRLKGFSPSPNRGQAPSPAMDGDDLVAAIFSMSPLERRKFLHIHNSWPRFFYKFRAFSGEDRLRSQMVRNEIFLSSPRDFNDPFDMRGMLAFKGGINALIRKYNALPISKDARRKAIKDARNGIKAEGLERYVSRIFRPLNQFDEMIGEQGVHCFASREKGVKLSGPRNNLMWSHYGDSHKGYCLQYSVHTDPVFVRSVRVRYASEYPVINWLSDSFPDDVLKCVTQKDKCWEHECEWRYIRPDTAKQLFSINGSGIKSVIIGSEATPASIELVMQMAQERDSVLGVKTHVFLAERSRTQYRLSFSRIR
jgi:hypothetical protein